MLSSNSQYIMKKPTQEMHSLACLIHKMGIFFTSYAQQIQRQIGSKPQTEIPI